MNTSRTSSGGPAALLGLFLVFCTYLDAFRWTLMDRSWLNTMTVQTLFRWGMSAQDARSSTFAYTPFLYFVLMGMGLLFAFSLREWIQRGLAFPYLLMSQSRFFTPLLRTLAGTNQSNLLFGATGRATRIHEDDVSLAIRHLSLVLSVVLIGYLGVTAMQAGAGELALQSSLPNRLAVLTLLWSVPLIVIGYCPPSIPHRSLS